MIVRYVCSLIERLTKKKELAKCGKYERLSNDSPKINSLKVWFLSGCTFVHDFKLFSGLAR